MGRFLVGVDTDSAAFRDPRNVDDGAYLRAELADILRTLRIKVTSEHRLTERDEDDPFVLFDSNGNRVGTARFEKEE